MIRKTKGFTLVEILVSTVIIAIISIGTYTTFFILSEAAQASQNQLYAITLAQGVLEDVRLKAKNNFDGLEREVFVDIDQRKYPTFYRQVTISPISSLYKKADITIGWAERGQPRQYRLSLFISRSSEPLPANIRGTITNSKTGAPILGAAVRITYVTNPNLNYTFPSTPANGKYTFVDGAGNFQLKAGDWQLKVTPPGGYYDPPIISVTNLSSGEDRTVDVKLDPKPEPAYIRGKVVDAANGNRLITSGSVYVSLYERGVRQSSVYCNNNGNGFKFTVPFDKTDPRSFTIVTSYRGYDDSTYLSWYCGNIPDIYGWGKSYNYRGWSSSVVREDGTFNRSNPWYGNSATDRITVGPGDDKDIGGIPLVPVPLTTINGNVYDSLGTPVPHARVILAWHSGDWIYDIRTNSKGFYERQVPAEQELFPDVISYHLRAYAEGNAPVVGSCGISTTTGVNTGWMILAEPLYTGNAVTHDFRLPGATPARYGNAEGHVKDGQSGDPIRNASVEIWGWVATDASGKYEFKCDPDHAAYFKIPQGAYLVSVRKSGYYDFRNNGALSTVYSLRSNIYISPERTTTYEDVRLWPIGPRGRIHGKVVDVSDGTTVIENARVGLTGRGQDRTETTGSDGEFGFPKNGNSSWYLYETLPVPAAKGDPYYNQQPQNYSLTVTDSRYEDYSVSNIILDAGVDKDLVVQLTKKQGM